MMLILSITLGGLGLSALLAKRSFVGVLVGVHLLFLSVSTAFVAAGVSSGQFRKGYVFALFIALVGLAQMVAGWALALRLYYLNGTSAVDTLKSLKE